MTTENRANQMLLGRLLAGIDLLGCCGADGVEVAHDEDPIQWWVGANWGGHRVFSERFPYPAQAIEDLLSKVVNGGLCVLCGNTTVVGVMLDGPYCCFGLIAKDPDDPASFSWVRSCEVTANG